MLPDNIITDEKYYMSGDIRVSFYYDEEMGYYVITGIRGKSEELWIPNKINSVYLGDMDGYYEGDMWFERAAVNEGNSRFKVIDGVLFSGDTERLLIYPPGKRDVTYAVPKGVRDIGEDALCGRYLKKLYLPEGVKMISQYACGCTELEEIYIPRSLKKVYFKAFAGCNNIRRVFYGGSSEDWENIDFTDFNNCLTEAEILYNRDISPGS